MDKKNEKKMEGEEKFSQASRDPHIRAERDFKTKEGSGLEDPVRKRMETRKRHRAQHREKRMLYRLLALLVVLCLVFFLGKAIKQKFFPPKEISDGGKQTGQSILPQPEASEETPQANKDQENGASQESKADQSQAPEASGIFAGFAQPNANTGDVVQDAKGKGKNHNAAASVYAYNVPDVMAGMFEGKEIAPGKMAFLTYDDGVSAESTPLLLDELKRLGVPATFFMVGRTFFPENKPLLDRMMQEGHALAYHSYNHEYGDLYPGRVANAEEILAQYKQCRDALTPLVGEGFSSNVWRYPGGHMSWKEMDAADQALEAEGVHWIDWNVLNSDAEGKDKSPTTVQGQVDAVLNSWASYGYPNVICVLMHDTPAKTLTRESLESIVHALREEGFSFGVLE